MSKAKFKVKVSGVTEEGLKRSEEINLNKMRALLREMPFATTMYLAIRTKLPITFIEKHFENLKKEVC